MLRIYYGDIKNATDNTDAFFDNTYLDNWLTDELSLKIIKAINKGEVVSKRSSSRVHLIFRQISMPS